MAGVKSVYVCNNCGAEYGKWFGKCPNCGEWNSLVEELVEKKAPKAGGTAVAAVTRTLAEVDCKEDIRYTTGISEFDRVLGGGIVKGSIVLLGGEPGAGKSTLLLQMCDALSQGACALYISGEESSYQIKLRANRLGVHNPGIEIACETDIDSICHTIRSKRPSIVVIDSIQTMNSSSVSSSPGSVAQVRECTSALQRVAKSEEIPIFIVGHVNKDGAIAGPKVIEHIVDTVLHFEGDRFLPYRILRAVKNRFGSTNEIGLFDMGQSGLQSVLGASEMLLGGRDDSIPGSCVTCVMEGTRPILAEVQTLAAKTAFGNPRRTSTGLEYNRLNLLLAVLEKRAGYFLSTLDVYLNVVGGLQLGETSSDLAVAVSIVSALNDKPVWPGCLAIGEIGLGGEIRSISNATQRIQEAVRLGFHKIILPKSNLSRITEKIEGVELIGISSVREISNLFHN